MDYLVKQNIIKKNKVIIDIGRKHIKILGVNYAGGKITINSSYKIDSSNLFFEGELSNIKELTRTISSVINRTKLIKNGEISLNLPSSMVRYKIEFAKNIKTADLEKHIKSNNQLSKVSELTHNIDWSYLGEREENGDTLKYYLVGAVNKSVVMPIIEEFEKRNLKITSISFSENNIVSLSDLYHNDFEHMHKLYIDFGTTNTKVLVESSGTFVYSRVIDIGFNTFVDRLFEKFEGLVGIPEIISLLNETGLDKEKFFAGIYDKGAYFDVVDILVKDFQDELIRIIRMCENDGIDISKIVCVSDIISGMLDSFTENDITVDMFDLDEMREINGSNYVLFLDKADVDRSFGNAIGLSLATMQNAKRLNLLPKEYKEKQINKYLIYAFGGIGAILALIMIITYINLGIANLTLNKLQKEDTVYKQKQTKIATMQETIKTNNEFVVEHEKAYFPFYEFMQVLEYQKPYGLTIISVDSIDMLVNKMEAAGEKPLEETKKDGITGNPEQTPTPIPKPPTVEYTKDLSGEKLSIRGYSSNPSDISIFLYDLSKLPYIADLELKAIEENKINGVETINVFEAILTLGGNKN